MQESKGSQQQSKVKLTKGYRKSKGPSKAKLTKGCRKAKGPGKAKQSKQRWDGNQLC